MLNKGRWPARGGCPPVEVHCGYNSFPFHHSDLAGRVPPSPEKRFPINRQCSRAGYAARSPSAVPRCVAWLALGQSCNSPNGTGMVNPEPRNVDIQIPLSLLYLIRSSCLVSHPARLRMGFYRHVQHRMVGSVCVSFYHVNTYNPIGIWLTDVGIICITSCSAHANGRESCYLKIYAKLF